MNGLTTMASFGSLLVAHHRGVWSLGVLVIGSAMTLTASLLVLPTLARLILASHSNGNGAASPAPVVTSARSR